MKNFHQNLLIILALSLCGLCIFQWYGQTQQRNEINQLNQAAYQKSEIIRDLTNSVAVMQHQIAEMDGRIGELKDTVKTNDQTIVSQKRELNRLEAEGEALTNEISDYKKAVDTLEARLKDAYDGVKKQNQAIAELTAQRDEFVKKYNDSVTDRNGIVKKYNELADQIEKLQPGGAKPGK
jgi:chromosome segregation ATPase